jgi:DNA-directed RNA polymerase specialized sigma24 family protein
VHDLSEAQADLLLEQYLHAQDAREEARLLDSLATELRSIVQRVLGRLFGRGTQREHLEDVCQDCLVSVLSKIDRLKRGVDSSAVHSLGAYAAVAARNSFRGSMREQYHERHRSRQRLLDTLRQEIGRVSVWNAGGALVCGLAEWEGSPLRSSARYQEWLLKQAPHVDDWRRFVNGSAGCAAGGPGPGLAVDRLVEFLRWIGSPVAIDDLIPTAGDPAPRSAISRGLFANRAASGDDPGGPLSDPLEQAPDGAESVEDHAVEKVHREQLLQKAWGEIRSLPLRQRYALLLALPPEAFLAYRLMVGRRELCESLECTAEELDSLPPRLPLSDAELASALGLRRQQVINLRLSARQRLGRRLTKW